MKKYILIIFLLIITYPTVTFAAWWNPLTWFNNWNPSRRTEKTEVLENKINTLEHKLKLVEMQNDNNNFEIETETAIENGQTEKNANQLKYSIPTKIVNPTVSTITDTVPEKPIIKIEEDIIEKRTVTKPEESNLDIAISQDDISNSFPIVDVTIFEDGYGGYRLRTMISAGNKDIYIPKTTSDSTRGYTGFSYSIIGSDFNGYQRSEVSCSIINNNNCKIKAGDTSEISVQIWLVPKFHESGNYAVRFNNIGYRYEPNGQAMYTLALDRESDKIYISNETNFIPE